jgi:hypothetical protein
VSMTNMVNEKNSLFNFSHYFLQNWIKYYFFGNCELTKSTIILWNMETINGQTNYNNENYNFAYTSIIIILYLLSTFQFKFCYSSDAIGAIWQ